MALEKVVRPNQRPDLRPQYPLGLQTSVVLDAAEAIVWGSSGDRIFSISVHFSASIPPVYEEQSRTYDVVRVKNKDDKEQYVDVEVMTKYVGINQIDQSRTKISLDRVQSSSNVEVLSSGNERGS